MEPDKVVIIVRNSLGQFFVHQRSAEKETFPLLYGLGAGGHVELKEKPEDAAERELREELKIDAEVKPLFKTSFESVEVSHTIHIFEVLWNGEIAPCEEFEWSGWLNEEEVNQLSVQNKLCPDTDVLYNKYRITALKG